MSEEKKKQILKAASECFAKYGYKKTTLDDIGEKIGLNKASLYYYFKNKEEIFITIVMNEFQRFNTELSQIAEENIDCVEKICKYFEKRLIFINESMGHQVISEMNPKKLQLLVESAQELLIRTQVEEQALMSKILKKCIENGEIKDCNVEKISEYLYGLVRGIKHGVDSITFKKFPESELNKKLYDIRVALRIFINGLK